MPEQNEPLRISEAHRPDLSPGAYKLSLTWAVNVREGDNDGGDEQSTFQIAGDRFSLKPADVHSMYPPEGGSADYADVVPHIALSRDTLPWERSGRRGSDAPWLVLLLLSEAEAKACPLRTISLKDLGAKLGVQLESGEKEEDSVKVIQPAVDLLRSILPKYGELSKLCHVRVAGNSLSVVAGKRLPSHGLNTAHLVAVENRYLDTGFQFGDDATCTLVSLKSWSFSCTGSDAPQQESIDKLFVDLSVSLLQMPKSGNTTAQSYFALGLGALPHDFRTGESGVSWYGGPFAPSVTRFKQANLLKMPARSADQLLLYDPAIGMLTVTYSAAWELGRLLAVQNRRAFKLLHDWRHQQIHCAHSVKEGAMDGTCCHIPQIQCACSATTPPVPAALKAWIDDIAKLKGVPYRYLVADERMLPPESIRFFILDPQYIEALLDGALSSVRSPTECPDECRTGEQELLRGAPTELVTGFLLRSAAVAGWPDMVVRASGKDGTRLEEHHRALSSSILLYMFRGDIRTVDIEQGSGTVHLSVNNHLDKLDNTLPSGDTRLLDVSKFTSGFEFADTLLDRVHVLRISIPGGLLE